MSSTEAAAPASSAAPIMELLGVAKSFGTTRALEDVSLSLRPGEVHALLGENGAGKSTLIKIMTGVYQADRGEILLKGQPVTLRNSADAQQRGIAAIYQEPLLFPDLSIAENIFIGHQGRGPFTHWGQIFARAEEILASIGVTLDVRNSARGLTLAAQQSVEIAKAISLNVRVLIMDEPTASLSAHEVERLFRLVGELRDKGIAILFVSHRMDEVFRLADTITVFRDGRRVSSRPRGEVTPQSAIADMVGREVSLLQSRPPSVRSDLLLRVNGLSRRGVFDDVNFDLHRGEVLGFAGLIGAGRTDVALAIFGIQPASSGGITFKNEAVTIRTPRDAIGRGIAYVSEDRRQLGLSMPMPVYANISLPTLSSFRNWLGLLSVDKERQTAERYRELLAIHAASVDMPVGSLSGGNQQKVMLAKWLNTKPDLLILDEPTRGIDVGAKAEVHRMIAELADGGMGVIVISSDLPEVLAVSDRVLVMREGRQMATLDREEATERTVMAAAMGL
jgi:rhamnose transport system ATP-binding protein